MPDVLDILLRDLKRLSAGAAVGAHDEANAAKLAYAEFGTPIAPARPALSAATDRAQAAVFAAVARKVGAVLDGRSRAGEAIVQDVGADLAEQVRDEIGNNLPPPLADSTIAARRRRGNLSTRTLVDSGDMQAAIKSEARAGENQWPDDE